MELAMTIRDPFLPPLSDDSSRALPPVDDVDDIVLGSETPAGRNASVPAEDLNEPEDAPHPYFDPTAGAFTPRDETHPRGEPLTVRELVSGIHGQADQAPIADEEQAHQSAQHSQSMGSKGIDSAAAGLGQVASALRAQGDGPLGTAATKSAETLDQASSYLQEANTEQLIADIESMVRKRPIESVLVAAGVGYLLSKVLS
jgi:ElaB/YqjD/DUF883 family membrane-anchored ribosome-binding protein